MKYVSYTIDHSKTLIHIPYIDWRMSRAQDKLVRDNTLCIHYREITVEHYYGDTPERFRDISISDIKNISNALKTHRIHDIGKVKLFITDFMTWWLIHGNFQK